MMQNKIPHKHLVQHETKRHAFMRFLFVLLIFGLYFVFIAWKYGISQGFFVTSLTWSFFVLCTPVADAGFLIDFPVRLLTNIRMLTAEIFVWAIAIVLNIYAFFFSPEIYNSTALLSLFHHILVQPIPFWSIILLSLIGTFISIGFGDELMDTINHHERNRYHKHKNNHRIILMIFLFFISFILYDFLLKALGVNVPL